MLDFQEETNIYTVDNDIYDISVEKYEIHGTVPVRERFVAHLALHRLVAGVKLLDVQPAVDTIE